MARITIEDCLRNVPNRFVLVHAAAKRVRQFREGSEYLVKAPKNDDIVVALREIASGKIKVKPINIDLTPKADDAGLLEGTEESESEAEVQPEAAAQPAGEPEPETEAAGDDIDDDIDEAAGDEKQE